MANATAYLHLQNGSYIQSAVSVYTAVMGDWWYIIMYVATLLLMYLWSRNDGAVAVMGLVGAAYMRFATDISASFYPILYLIAVLNLAMLLYKAFGKGK